MILDPRMPVRQYHVHVDNWNENGQTAGEAEKDTGRVARPGQGRRPRSLAGWVTQRLAVN